MENSEEIIITSFYHFVDLPTYEQMKDELLNFCKQNEIMGTILLASEGINSTIAGSRQSIDIFYSYLKDVLKIPVCNYKESKALFKPFSRMKVRLKKEIVALGVENLDIIKYKGEYIDPENWDDFLKKEDVVLIDTRNKYETKLGTFQNAIDPKTKTFREFPAWVEENKDKLEGKKIAMFCTGGVRCEKSTSYLKQKGYKEVYHLEGGVINYLHKTGNKSHLWQGDCFVFDERVALNTSLQMSKDVICRKCSSPLTTDDVRDNANLKKLICIACSNLN